METATTLESLVPGARVDGPLPGRSVTVVAVQWNGQDALTLTYRADDGAIFERMVFRGEEAPWRVDADTSRAFAFDADGHHFHLAAEARRIRLAYLFDPMLAVHLSSIEPLPHQIQAVYAEMLPRQPLRYLLADDPGAGKTIMAGLYIRELMLHGDLDRCLIVVPGSLTTQWQDELADKFDLPFDILTRDSIEASRTGNAFAERNLLIARLDHLARNDDIQARLAETDWDLVVVDEAHRMAAHWFGREVKETKRYRLGRVLGGITRHFLLMTATPHAGKEEDFQLFMALLDGDRFEGRFRDGVHKVDATDMMRRMVKENLLRFDGTPLFPERRAYTVPYPLSTAEARLYEQVTAYVTDEMNRADRLAAAGEGRRGNRVGFALTVLQRRLASSPAAIHESLRRRRQRLEARLAEERLARRSLRRADLAVERYSDIIDDDDEGAYDELPDDEAEQLEEALVDSASAAATLAELEAEIATLTGLEESARRLRESGFDRKWQEFASLLEDDSTMRHADGRRRKLLVFTEHRDTLSYLVERLETLLGRAGAVVSIHGGMLREERRKMQELFTEDPDCVVLVATDAAGEGINLQRAHLVVNYDLPWNPTRIEQRFGRVHRIGQTEVCHMWNLVAEDTREGQVYRLLLDKLAEARDSLGGQVFDVLGEAFSGQPLRDLLLEAIRYGDQPEVRARLHQVIDARVGDGLAELVRERSLAADPFAAADVERVRLMMEEARARRLQPHYIRGFFLAALEFLGGRAAEREPDRYEITHVPADVRRRDRQIGRGAPLLTRYERITFDRQLATVDGKPAATLVTPGHPLLDAVTDMVAERLGLTLRQGAVLVDEGDAGDDASVLAFVEHEVRDARPRTVSKRVEFVSVAEARPSASFTAAPYLDYRPATAAERASVDRVLRERWLTAGVEQAVFAAAIPAAQAHLAEVRARMVTRVEKTRAAVHARLSSEIRHWDHRARELQEQVDAGRQPRMNPDRARARADELSIRLAARMAYLELEQRLEAVPPVITGAALVIPGGLLARTIGAAPPAHAAETEVVERRAVDAVLAAEKALGRLPEEMARNNPGFDIRSLTPDGHWLFVEVKGRVAGADSVYVTKNEILTSLNSERFVLALVVVHPDGTDEVRYLHRPFQESNMRLHFASQGVTFHWRELWDQGTEPR